MTNHYFYFSPRCYKVVRAERVLAPEILADLAHDFQASLNRKVEAVVPKKREEIQKERAAITTAQRGHTQFKKSGLYRTERDELIRQLLAHKVPNFGSVRLNITKGGV